MASSVQEKMPSLTIYVEAAFATPGSSSNSLNSNILENLPTMPDVIFAKEIPSSFTEDELLQFFAEHGVVTSVKLFQNPGGAPFGFAMLKCASKEEAEKLSSKTYLMNGQAIKITPVPLRQVTDGPSPFIWNRGGYHYARLSSSPEESVGCTTYSTSVDNISESRNGIPSQVKGKWYLQGSYNEYENGGAYTVTTTRFRFDITEWMTNNQVEMEDQLAIEF